MNIIAHNRPTLGIEEEQAAVRVIRSGWLAQGKEVETFENEFCDFLGIPHGHAVAVSSGTAALFLALWVLGAQGREVAFPVYACSALRNAVAMAGAYEMLLDTAPDSPNIDVNVIAKRGAGIAIVPHMFGLPVDISVLNDVDIIEDCAQAIGASINGTSVGLKGKIGIFSFYVSKLITTGGQGGMVVSRDKQLSDAVRDYRQFDCRRDSNRRFNFQITDLHASIGREQLLKLSGFLEKRNKLFMNYKNAGLDLLDIQPQDSNRIKPVRYRAVIKTQHPQRMIEALYEANVKSIVPIEDWELLGDGRLYPNAYILTKSTVSLPLYPSLSDDEIESVLKGVFSI